ncbi:MAG TPA: GNAT family N-acetyltransferase [Gemmataceae bacterium]|nr:GNAT family N-acetyltransferase [Gemmataceae bacterium]
MHIRALTAEDIAFGLSLCAQNRWNQLEPDWQRQLALEPAGCFVAEHDGQRAGTACFCTFGAIAWINLVLVERTMRKQGIGTALLRHVLDALDARGITSVRLDATALGQPVYARLGFAPEFTLARFAGVPAPTADSPAGVEPVALSDLPALYALDEAVTGTRRDKLLRHFLEHAPATGRKIASPNQVEGFCWARPGANAWHIGPVQGSPAACRPLLLDAANRFAGQRVYIDVPIANAEAMALMEELRFTEERRFVRMGRGPRVVEQLHHFWGSFGPEKG